MIETALEISVIICAYTEKRWIDMVTAIESVRRQTLPASEIILVIDHNPRLFERAQSELHDLIVVENTRMQGLSGARNSGVAASHNQWVAFLDDDAIAFPDWLELMARCCEDTNVLGVGGLVTPLWPDKGPGWFPAEFYWVIGCSYQDFGGRVTKVRNAFGGNICVRREIFEKVGGFREGVGRTDVKSLPMGGEETELCIRAQHYWPNKIFLCEPNAITDHRIQPERINGRYFRSRCYAEGLSKALVAFYAGSKDGLASEQSHMLTVLPRGVMRGIRDGLLRRDAAGFARSWMIIVGVTTTVLGYLIGRLSLLSHSRERGSQELQKAPDLIEKIGGTEVSL